MRRAANAVLRPLRMELVRREPHEVPLQQLLLALRRFDVRTVVDVGANTGQFAQELLAERFAGRIVSIEPLPAAHALLAASAERHANWTVLPPVAVGVEAGEVEFHVAGNSVSSSVLRMLERHIDAAPASAPLATLTVAQTTLDALVLAHLPAEGGLLLKIDTQGYERSVLLGADGCLRRADLVLLELSLQPLYGGQALWLEMIALMAARGFEVWSIQPEFCDPESGQLLQVNGLFRRTQAREVSA